MRHKITAAMRLSFLALALGPALSRATPPDTLEIGRYLAKYPGLSVQGTVSYDPRDAVFDADGSRIKDLAPAYSAAAGSGNSRFPETRFTLDLDWSLPLFEASAIPFVSSRLWNARARLGYAMTNTDGPIGNAADAAGGPTSKSGVTDLELAFGPALIGSADWKTRTATPFSMLLLAEVRLPIGARNADSPNNVGDSTYAYGGRLGAHWQPGQQFGGALSGFLLDAGVRYRVYGADQEPAFNAQSPTQQGADFSADATLARRLWRGLYAQVSYSLIDGAANEYRNVRSAASPPAAGALMDTFPDPAPQRDRGTREQRLQFGLGGFLTQRLWLGAQYLHPLSGRSGSFNLPYQQQLQNCSALGGCNPTPNGSAPVDGLGSARAFASDSVLVTVRWSPPSSRGPRF